MCGIIAILGRTTSQERLLQALRRLEYRGYDSAGIAVSGTAGLQRRRAAGKLNALESLCAQAPIDGPSGIGHTRWATHGPANEVNAHPHMTAKLALVHNGIIENFRALKAEIEEKGYHPEGQTDSEIITHLLDHYLLEAGDPVLAFRALLGRLEGAFALAILMQQKGQDILLLARRGSPLVIGLGDGETYAGSDAVALSGLTKRLIYLEEGDHACLSHNAIQIFDAHNKPVERPLSQSALAGFISDKGNHRHYMQKEIFEQPTAFAQTIGSYLDMSRKPALLLPELPFDLAKIDRISFVACGTAFYAGSIARYWVEQLAHVAASADIASEFRYRAPIMSPHELVVFISQSGETADTLAALKLAKQMGQKTLAIINMPESSIAREADALLPTHAGLEVGVASTKAFTSQLGVLALLALALAAAKDRLAPQQLDGFYQELQHIPAQMAKILNQENTIETVANEIAKARDVFFVGRGLHYPLALEGALKLKEISYIHAEGYAAGELKHGPLALVDEKTPVIGLAPSHELFDKTQSNLQEIEARGGRVILISDSAKPQNASLHIDMPPAGPLSSPILYALPVQLLAYHTALAKGTDVDQPRNLAKSVTVE